MKTINPVILVDTREQAPLRFQNYQTEIATLPIGDYGLKNFSGWANPRFIVERKSLADLIGSLSSGRDRFYREIEKLRQFEFRAIGVEAFREQIECKDYASQMTPQSILASVDAIEVRANIHMIWAGDAGGLAARIESLARQFVRGIERQYKLLNAMEGESADVVAPESPAP